MYSFVMHTIKTNLLADCELFKETNYYLIYPFETDQQLHSLLPG